MVNEFCHPKNVGAWKDQKEPHNPGSKFFSPDNFMGEIANLTYF